MSRDGFQPCDLEYRRYSLPTSFPYGLGLIADCESHGGRRSDRRGSAGASPYRCVFYSIGCIDSLKGHGRASLPASHGGSRFARFAKAKQVRRPQDRAAPTGHHETARGNAPGNQSKRVSALKGRNPFPKNLADVSMRKVRTPSAADSLPARARASRAHHSESFRWPRFF